MDDSFYTFPSTREEALTMLYLENQDLSGKTPAQIHTMYWETIKAIRADYTEKKQNGYKFR